ncbi:hypothetical protein JOL79_00695 [Microbispora sp. RL4-1S]|uniref:DUF2567 domain-containing protein n=1 Tax=Microbispora oryzae TaxID=2806554 RepID=A0A941AH49_9ACTN|nr:hypothetical protein [Microbispora oryzae]MBP2702312.1 hypothetical protein [Microbispora oryzae]
MRHLRVNPATIALTVLASALLGVVAGFVWAALAPATRYVLVDGGPQPADPETQTLIAADGWFAVVTGAAGLLCAAVAYLLARRRPVEALTGLTAGGLLAAYVALLVGGTVKGVVRASAPGGLTTTTSLGVTAHGVLLAWPLLATALFWLIEFLVTYQRRADPAA